MDTYPIGSIIYGRYEIASHPLKGGMGIVYLCYDNQEERPVALKTFKSEFLQYREARQRFLQEGTTWMNLGAHPNIVRCYGVQYVGDGREVYLILEQIAKEGNYPDASLRSRIVRWKPLKLEDVLLYALQITRGMNHAVQNIPGFVHRDLKPENVLVGADRLPNSDVNRVRVTDFGLARVVSQEDVLISSKQNIDKRKISELFLSNGRNFTRGVGTPLYMAPEQWKGDSLSVSTDIYAFGLILYEMLTSEFAVVGNSVEEIMYAHLNGQLKPIPTSIPEGVKKIVLGCINPISKNRYSNWVNVGNELEKIYVEISGQVPPSINDPIVLGKSEKIAQGYAQNSLGGSYQDIGMPEKAYSCYKQAWKIGVAENDRWLEASGLLNMGGALKRLHKQKEAKICFEKSLKIAEKMKIWGIVSGAHNNLGIISLEQGNFDEAVNWHKQGLILARQINDPEAEAVNLGNLGLVYTTIGQVGKGIKNFQEQLSIYRKYGLEKDEIIPLTNIGRALIKIGEMNKTIQYYEKALSICQKLGIRSEEGTILNSLGLIYRVLSNTNKAVICYSQAIKIAKELNDPKAESQALTNLGTIYISLDDSKRAWECNIKALDLAQSVGDRRGEGTILGNLGLVSIQMGDINGAMNYLQQSMEISMENNDLDGQGVALLQQATLYEKIGQIDKAIALAKKSMELFQIVKNPQANYAEQYAADLQRGLRRM